MNTTVYLLNRVPTKAVEGKTPFEVWYGKKPAVHHLKTFGCIVYVKNTAPHLKKLEDRGRKMIFVGYEKVSKAYRSYDPIAGTVHVTRNVIFDESAQWDWSGGDETSTGVDHGGEFIVQNRTVPGQEAELVAHLGSPATPPSAMEPRTPPVTSTAAGGASPDVDDDLDADHDDEAPLRFRTMENVVGSASPPGYAVRDLGSGHVFAVSAEEPGTLAQAEQDPRWRWAMEEELGAIEENNTWALTELPLGRRAIGL